MHILVNTSQAGGLQVITLKQSILSTSYTSPVYFLNYNPKSFNGSQSNHFLNHHLLVLIVLLIKRIVLAFKSVFGEHNDLLTSLVTPNTLSQ